MSLSSAKIVDDTQRFLDSLQPGARIEYDESSGADSTQPGSLLVMLGIECPHCGRGIEIEYDLNDATEDEEFD